MNRRAFVSSGAAVGAAASLGAAASRSSILELRYIRMRNGVMGRRTTEFYSKHYQPALRKAGAGPACFFSSVIGEQSPFMLAVLSYPSLAAMESVEEKLAADSAFQAAFGEYNSTSELSYIRMESSLLRGFRTVPGIEMSPAAAAPRVFELRTYESMNATTCRRKVKMFDDDGEIDLFRRFGMQPVFFGEAIAGKNLPNLTYMLAFDDLTARDKAWRAFATSPEWKKLSGRPELADALLVSNISNSILRPLPFSDVR
jgi:hypothetical protein